MFPVLAALLGFNAISGAQEKPAPPAFSLSLVAAQTAAKAGSPIALAVTLTNVSDHGLRGHFERVGESVMRAHRLEDYDALMRNVDIKVFDSDGKQVPETEYGAAVHGRPPINPSPGPSSGRFTSAPVPFLIGPGKSLHENADLNKEFELTKPGKYTVQAQRYDNESNTLVTSNVITLTITQ
jgi:hypothetical protein